MAKKKKSAALFELIGGQADSKALDVPNWARQGPGAGGAPTATPRKAVRLKQPPGLISGQQAETELPAEPATRHAPNERIALVHIADGRLVLNLGYVSCLVACLGLIVLMVAFYKLGQSARPAPAAPVAEAATEGVLPAAIGADSAVDRYNYAQAQQDAYDRLAGGGDFLVVQGAVENMADAQAIQRFLKANGFMPYIVDGAASGICVMDSFDLSKTDQAGRRRYARSIERLGAEPAWQHKHKYNFKQPEGQLWIHHEDPQGANARSNSSQ